MGINTKMCMKIVLIVISLFTFLMTNYSKAHRLDSNRNVFTIHSSHNKAINRNSADAANFLDSLSSQHGKARQKRQDVAETPVHNDAYKTRLADYHNMMRRLEPGAASMLKSVCSEFCHVLRC